MTIYMYSGFTHIHPLNMVIYHSYVNVYQRLNPYIPSLLALNHWESLGHIATVGNFVSFHPSNRTNATSFECHAALCVNRVAFRPDEVISQVRICVFQCENQQEFHMIPTCGRPSAASRESSYSVFCSQNRGDKL